MRVALIILLLVSLVQEAAASKPRLRPWSEDRYPAAQIEHRPGPDFAWHRVRWPR